MGVEALAIGWNGAAGLRRAGGRLVLQGEIRDLSEGGTQIVLREPLYLASSVKIEYADKILLGEVVYCRQEQAWWVLGIRAERALS